MNIMFIFDKKIILKYNIYILLQIPRKISYTYSKILKYIYL